MAERRMFAKTIIDSDAFLDMPTTTQLLYFHLSMRADDDGFINKPKTIMRMVGSSDDDIKLLIAKKFLIPFESGVVVIKHWKIHNYIQKDRYTETKYKDEKSLLSLDENKSYTLCIHPVHELDTQVRLGKDRLGKVRVGKENISGCDDERARAHEAIINNYEKYFDSSPTSYETEEIIRCINYLHHRSGEELPAFTFGDGEKELLEIAFESAANANQKTLAYLQGVFKNFWRRKIRTPEDYWSNLYERDRARGKI